MSKRRIGRSRGAPSPKNGRRQRHVEARLALRRSKGGITERRAYAEALVQAGKLREAAEEFRRIVREDPDDFEAHGKLGYVLAVRGRLTQAVPCYEIAQLLAPDNPAIGANLGVLYWQLGNPHDARTCFEEALQIDPAHANSLFHMAVLFLESGHTDQARTYCRRAVSRYEALASRGQLSNPDDDLVKLGTAYFGLADYDKAASSFRTVIERKPNHAMAHLRLGMALNHLDRKDEASLCFRRAVDLRPADPQARAALGMALRSMGEPVAAADALKAALERGFEDPSIEHFLSALTGDTTATPPKRYVESLFDDYADRFDAHLIKGLGYRSPWDLREALDRCAGPGPHRWKIVDLGCGTGLCGPLFRPLAAELLGVDLSPRMLEKARARAVYDELIQGDLVQSLSTCPGDVDLALAADVLIYLGDLAPLMSAVTAALRAGGGRFAFTTEIATEGDFVLEPSGRYSHADSYIEALAASRGLVVEHIEKGIARQESGKPVPTSLHVLRLGRGA